MSRRALNGTSAPFLEATGKTGATATPVMLAGGTASGAPASGAHVKGEVVVDDTGRIYYCTAAGTPGTWVDAYGNLVTSSIATHDADAAAHTAALDDFSLALLQFDPTFLNGHCLVVDDFVSGLTTSGDIGEKSWISTPTGTGTVSLPAGDFDEPGYVNLNVPVVNDVMTISLDPYLLKGSPRFVYESRIRINGLADGTDNLTMRVGVMSAPSGGGVPSDGIWFLYNVNDTTIHAQTRTASGTARNEDTNFTMSASAWMRFGMICDGGGSVDYFVNGTAVVTIATDTPTTQNMTPRFQAYKALGSGNTRILRVGYMYLLWDITR